ncbi:hypothetical protein BDK51DRAFT_39572 [Blyttiomyces helicus]|uniref:Uncharacterized protein n=1 Tax=Blyttiomyces helicus TaxID=388810 RepID=A0A4P9WAG6_9FUNG|nr:hypothetical protein BDK51DRAFT_39572 [Blyttiomyces helicus]|eukprot:RKO88503.1 hypothetical protein BDK51DRAFT_39572 [Blyttiomyces helicus]
MYEAAAIFRIRKLYDQHQFLKVAYLAYSIKCIIAVISCAFGILYVNALVASPPDPNLDEYSTWTRWGTMTDSIISIFNEGLMALGFMYKIFEGQGQGNLKELLSTESFVKFSFIEVGLPKLVHESGGRGGGSMGGLVAAEIVQKDSEKLANITSAFTRASVARTHEYHASGGALLDPPGMKSDPPLGPQAAMIHLASKMIEKSPEEVAALPYFKGAAILASKERAPSRHPAPLPSLGLVHRDTLIGLRRLWLVEKVEEMFDTQVPRLDYSPRRGMPNGWMKEGVWESAAVLPSKEAHLRSSLHISPICPVTAGDHLSQTLSSQFSEPFASPTASERQEILHTLKERQGLDVRDLPRTAESPSFCCLQRCTLIGANTTITTRFIQIVSCVSPVDPVRAQSSHQPFSETFLTRIAPHRGAFQKSGNNPNL